MDREQKIQSLAKQIQKRIDQLKELNCSIDSSYNTIGVFDDEIEPTLISRYGATDNIDYSEQIVFAFDTAKR